MKLNNITILLEGEPGKTETLRYAINFAKENSAHIHFLRVVESYSKLSLLLETPTTTIKKTLHNKLETEIEALSSLLGDVTYSSNLREGVTFVEAIREISRTKSSMLIIPEPDKLPIYFTNTYEHLARKCPAPIWLIKNSTQQNPQHILVVIDIDTKDCIKSSNNKCMDIARNFSSITNKGIDLIHTWSLPNEYYLSEVASNISQSRINEIISKEQLYHEKWFNSFIKSQKNIRLNTANLLNGDKSRAIIDLVQKKAIDLLIIATVNDTNTPGLLISNEAENILQNITCSVIAIKPDGFHSPVI